MQPHHLISLALSCRLRHARLARPPYVPPTLARVCATCMCAGMALACLVLPYLLNL